MMAAGSSNIGMPLRLGIRMLGDRDRASDPDGVKIGSAADAPIRLLVAVTRVERNGSEAPKFLPHHGLLP